MLHVLLRLFAVLALCLGALSAPEAGAQGLLSIARGDGDSATSDAVADAIREVRESGQGVVVIDAQGNVVVSGIPAAAPPDAASADPMQQASRLMRAQSEVQAFNARLAERFRALPDSVVEVDFILRATSPDERVMTYVETLLWLIGFLAIGRVFVRYVYGPKIAGRFIIPRIREASEGYREKMPFLFYRFLGGLGATIVMIVIALLLALIFLPHFDDLSIQFTVTAILTAFAMARTASDLWRMLLSPFLSQYRIPAFGDYEAKRLFYWASVMASYGAFSIIFSTWIKDFGLNYNVYALLHGFLTLIAILGNVLMLIVNGKAISAAIRGGRAPREVSWLLRALSLLWGPLLTGYFIFSWLELSFDLVMENPTSIPPVAGVYSTFLSIIVVYGFINYLIETYFSGTQDLRRINADLARSEAEEAAAEAQALGTTDVIDATDAPEPMEDRPYSIMTYQELAQRSAGILAFMAGTYALIRIWDTERAIQSSQTFGRILDVFVILFIGYVVYHLFRIWIDMKISEETSDAVESELGDEGGQSSASRLATLLPLFRGAMLAIVIVTITLIALMEVGINVSPLFAGAGVVGLAVGFGAQTLVRDIFSGAFFLFDDAFRRGEYIDIGSVKGTVEKISVRSFQLRHHLGALHTIPFGEIQVLTNYSRDWVIMKLPLRVTYDTDVEKVRKLIKDLGKKLLQDPVIGDNFIQPLKSQGVIEMQDSAMIIRVKFMTKPGDQWLVRKKVYEEIRHLFEKEDIRFAHREVTVRLADEKAEDLTPKQREAVTGAVQAAVDDEGFEGRNDND